jgi:hypothetical protein
MTEKIEVTALRKALANARTIEEQTIGFDGKFVKPQDVGLPVILS